MENRFRRAAGDVHGHLAWMRNATAADKRCAWASVDEPLLLRYHDREWGVPVHNDRKHFEVSCSQAHRRDWTGRSCWKSGMAIAARSTNSIPRKSRAIPREKSKVSHPIRRSFATGWRSMPQWETHAHFSRSRKGSGTSTPTAGVSSAADPSLTTGRLRADSSDFARIRRIQQGPQAPGIQLRWPDGRLCVHAGGWNGERSRRRLFPLSEDPAGARESQDVKFPFGPTRAVDLKLRRNARTWCTIPTLTSKERTRREQGGRDYPPQSIA